MDCLRQFILLKFIIFKLAICSHQITWLLIEGCCELPLPEYVCNRLGHIFSTSRNSLVEVNNLCKDMMCKIHERLVSVHETDLLFLHLIWGDVYLCKYSDTKKLISLCSAFRITAF